MSERAYHVRLVEALIFASAEPVSEKDVAKRLPEGVAAAEILAEVRALYAGRGVELMHSHGNWFFRTAPDVARGLQLELKVTRRMSRAALETLAIIAYHQPVTRAEIEDIRGVALSKGSLDVLLETGWVRPGKRRRTPGRPLTWISTDAFLQHFGLQSLGELPGVDDLRAAGLLDARPAIQAFHAADTLADSAEEEEAEEPLELDETAFEAEDEPLEGAPGMPAEAKPTA